MYNTEQATKVLFTDVDFYVIYDYDLSISNKMQHYDIITKECKYILFNLCHHLLREDF